MKIILHNSTFWVILLIVVCYSYPSVDFFILTDYNYLKKNGKGQMTQEQKINRGTVIIFILSILLVVCLCATATLAYFAGQDSNNVTLIMGGPVRVYMVDRNFNEYSGDGNLVMNLKSGRDSLLPGIGIDMQASAKITSSPINATPAMLRAILDVEVSGIDEKSAKFVESIIRRDLGNSITARTDTNNGWIYFAEDGYYYYCSKDKKIDEKTGEEYISLASIDPGSLSSTIPFINGTFQFPTIDYTNDYSNVDITFTLTFQAIQDQIVDENGDPIPNTIFNVKNVLDNLDWSKHND